VHADRNRDYKNHGEYRTQLMRLPEKNTVELGYDITKVNILCLCKPVLLLPRSTMLWLTVGN